MTRSFALVITPSTATFPGVVSTWILTLGMFGTSALSAEIPGLEINPERIFSEVDQELQALYQNLQSNPRLDAGEILTGNTEIAKIALDSANSYLSNNQWQMAIGEILTYQSAVQIPQPEDLPSSLYILGRSYEGLGRFRRATRYYSQYLANAVSYPDDQSAKILDVIQRLLPLATKLGQPKLVDELLATYSNLSLPKGLQHQADLQGGKAALQQGHLGLAERLLKQASRSQVSAIKSASFYNLGMLALNQKNDQDSAAHLQKAFESAASQDKLLRNKASLALGRLHATNRRVEAALKAFNTIEDSTILHADALFDQTYLLVDAGRFHEARAAATHLLSSYPFFPKNEEIRHLLIYLNVEASEILAAERGLREARQYCLSINQWLGRNISGNRPIDFRTLKQIDSLTQGHIRSTPLVETGLRLFGNLTVLENSLENTRADLQSLYFTIANRPVYRALSKLGKPNESVG